MIAKVNQKWIILITFCWRGIFSLSVSGTIEDDISFYYEELLVQPSLSATISYSITYPLTYHDDYVDFQLYTTQNHENIGKRCSFRKYGQTLNRYLYVTNSLNSIWRNCYESQKLHCRRVIEIQDYIPRRFGFSFGFDCVDALKKSLKGLTYSVEVSSQTNRTTCSTIPKPSVNCSRFHSWVSFPNLFGIDKRFSPSSFQSLLDTLNSSNVPLNCYPHLKEFVCNLYFPRCIRASNTVIVPCREMFEELMTACAPGLLKVKFLADPTIGSYNNEYLPSQDGSVPCLYKPVVCGPPPNATGVVIVSGLNDSGIYYGGTKLEYSCSDESLVILGNNTATCLYNGLWSQLPVCVKGDLRYLLRILLPILSFVLCVIVSVIVIIIWIKRRRKKTVLCLTRRRKFDAYVCYDFDQNNDFVMDTILPAFEDNENPPFKLCIHSRDFDPGVTIFENIQKAISQSNSAIIIMSQEFVDSSWCKKEFEQCFMENMNDPAFKLFLIMMQPADTLEGLSEYMASFIAQKTYLERHDPDLIGKLSQYLTWIKQPKEDRTEGMIELTDMGTV